MKKVKIILSVIFSCFCNFIYLADALDDDFCKQHSKLFRSMCITNNDQSNFLIKRTYHTPEKIFTEIEFFKAPDEQLVCEIFQLLQYMDYVALNETEEYLNKLKRISSHDGVGTICDDKKTPDSHKIALELMKKILTDI